VKTRDEPYGSEANATVRVGGWRVGGGWRLPAPDWASYGHDSSRRAHQVHEKHLNATTAKTLNFNTTGWMFQSTGGSFVASPTVFDSTVYIGDGVKGFFYAVHARGTNQGNAAEEVGDFGGP
jgi:hypothetical protein